MRWYGKFIKLNFKTIILLFLQTIIMVYSFISIISLINFKKDIKNYAEESFPINKTITLNFSKVINDEKFTYTGPRALDRAIYETLTKSGFRDKCYYNTIMYYNRDGFDFKDKVDIKYFKVSNPEDFNSYGINKEYYNDYIKKYVIGKGFTKDEFINLNESSENIPIILGSSFKGIYKEGDIITYTEGNNFKMTYKIVGILDKEVFIYSSRGAGVIASMESLDSSFIIPLVDDHIYKGEHTIDDLTQIIPSFVFKVKDKYDLDKAIQQLNTEMESKGFSCYLESVEKNLNKDLESIDNEISYSKVYVGMLTVLATILLVSTLMFVINKSTDIMGILIAVGANKTRIVKFLVVTMFNIMFFASAIAVPLSIKINKQVFIFFNSRVNIENYIYAIAAVSVIYFVSIIIPLVKIHKISIKELLGGMRQ